MRARGIGGVLIGGGLVCLLFYGAAFIYWTTSVGAGATKLLLLTGLASLAAGVLIYGLSPLKER